MFGPAFAPRAGAKLSFARSDTDRFYRPIQTRRPADATCTTHNDASMARTTTKTKLSAAAQSARWLPSAAPVGSLDPSAARGLMLMYRFTAEYGCGEEPPDFLKPDEIFLCPVVRGFQNRCVQALVSIFIYFTCTHYTLHAKSSTSMCYYCCHCYMCIVYFTGRKAATMKTKTMMTSPLLSQKLRIEINTKT